MRIGIDARFLTHPQAGGFKTYTTQLLAALANEGGEHEYVLYVDRAPEPGAAIPRGRRVTLQVVGGGMPIVGMPWREQVALRRAIARSRLDLFHGPCLTAPLHLECPSVVTIHDMIWHRPPVATGRGASGKRRLMDWYYRLVPLAAARRAAAVITVSQASRAQIIEDLGVDPGRIFVTYEGPAPGYRPADLATARAEVLRRFGLDMPYILAIGSADPRKNLEALVSAYALLPDALRAAFRLVIVWTHRRLADAVAAQAEELGLDEQLRHLSQVPDEGLAALYQGATVFAFPSLYEGFGLPPLEAMACGAPVVAGANSSIPEITGDAALLVDAASPRELSDALERALGEPELRWAMRERGLRQAARFSWARCAQETLSAYGFAARAGRGGALARRPGDDLEAAP